MRFLFIDTETTDLRQRRCVEIGAALFVWDGRTSRRIQTLSSLIQPTGWVISKEAREVHGISMADCRMHGKPLADVMRQFLALSACADVLVGHNLKFDVENIERDHVAVKIQRPDMPGLMWPPARYCTMRELTSYCALPQPGAHHRRWQVYKWPRLEELYRLVFRREMPEGHRALDDCLFTAECFFALLGAGIISQNRFTKKGVKSYA